MKTFIIVILIIDVASWFAWAYSGQMPVDGFYLGAITSNVINLFI